jgi:hypothetical protein
MRKLVLIAALGLLLIGSGIWLLHSSACKVPEPEAEPQPYEYTHSTELRQFEIYEYDRIKDIERSVVMTLGQLGYPNLTLAGGEESEAPSVEYLLPEDATQGPDIWYIVHFHFLIEFDESTGGGFGSVVAKGASASVQLETLRVNDSPYIRISGEPATSTSIRMEVRYYNYMSLRSVKPGKNEMTFSYKESQGTKIKSVTIFNDTGIESTTVPPSEYQTELAPEPASFEPFYGVGSELMTKLEQICLADYRVQELIKDREHTFVIDGHTVEDKDYNLAVGVRLKDDITSEEFREWMDGGRQDSSLIAEYVGVLNIGYNDKYHIVIDIEKEEIKELIREEKSGTGIPEATAEDKQRALDIAFADTTVQQILEGREYEIAPEGGIGVWHTGSTKLGVAFEIKFDNVCTIEGELPRYQDDTYHFAGEAEGLIISVLLEENRVARIIPMSPMPLD